MVLQVWLQVSALWECSRTDPLFIVLIQNPAYLEEFILSHIRVPKAPGALSGIPFPKNLHTNFYSHRTKESHDSTMQVPNPCTGTSSRQVTAEQGLRDALPLAYVEVGGSWGLQVSTLQTCYLTVTSP